MKCSFCSNEVPDNARTCPRCGIYLSRTFRNQNRDTGSEEDRIAPDSSADYRNPRNRREPRPDRDPREQRPEFSSDNAAPESDSRFGSSPDPRQTPHDFPEEPPFSGGREPPRRNFCSLCGNSLMPGGKKALLLAQSSTPALTMHIIRNLLHPLKSPWVIIEDAEKDVFISGIRFQKTDLRSW